MPADVAPAPVLSGCPPDAPLTLRLELPRMFGLRWRAEHPVAAGADGRVTVGADLLWTPAPDFASGRMERQDLPDATLVATVLDQAGRAITSAIVLREWLAAGVTWCNLDGHHGEPEGTLYTPPGTGPHPAVLAFGSSGGLLLHTFAALLASHGMATLALAYGDDEPRDEALRALDWLAAHERTASGRLGLLGVSLGAELALSAAARWQGPAAVVAYAPPPTAGEVDVEKVDGPIVLVAGEDDALWPSADTANRIAQRRGGHPHRTLLRCYAGAGHALRTPYLPTTLRVLRHPVTGERADVGGTPEGDARASADAWRALLACLAPTP